MSNLFYRIASAITEWITGCNGTGTGIQGIVNVIRYINVLEDVKLWLNILVFVGIAACIVWLGLTIWKFVDKKVSDRFIAIEVRDEN